MKHMHNLHPTNTTTTNAQKCETKPVVQYKHVNMTHFAQLNSDDLFLASKSLAMLSVTSKTHHKNFQENSQYSCERTRIGQKSHPHANSGSFTRTCVCTAANTNRARLTAGYHWFSATHSQMMLWKPTLHKFTVISIITGSATHSQMMLWKPTLHKFTVISIMTVSSNHRQTMMWCSTPKFTMMISSLLVQLLNTKQWFWHYPSGNLGREISIYI